MTSSRRSNDTHIHHLLWNQAITKQTKISLQSHNLNCLFGSTQNEEHNTSDVEVWKPSIIHLPCGTKNPSHERACTLEAGNIAPPGLAFSSEDELNWFKSRIYISVVAQPDLQQTSVLPCILHQVEWVSWRFAECAYVLFLKKDILPLPLPQPPTSYTCFPGSTLGSARIDGLAVYSIRREALII